MSENQSLKLTTDVFYVAVKKNGYLACLVAGSFVSSDDADEWIEKAPAPTGSCSYVLVKQEITVAEYVF